MAGVVLTSCSIVVRIPFNNRCMEITLVNSILLGVLTMDRDTFKIQGQGYLVRSSVEYRTYRNFVKKKKSIMFTYSSFVINSNSSNTIWTVYISSTDISTWSPYRGGLGRDTNAPKCRLLLSIVIYIFNFFRKKIKIARNGLPRVSRALRAQRNIFDKALLLPG